MSARDAVRVDRRTTIKWLAASMAAAYTGCSKGDKYLGEEIPPAATPAGPGYGKDPDLVNASIPWPTTMTGAERRTAAALSDMMLPADDRSPAASSVGVPDFIDEWVSAPYPRQQEDRALILPGLEWLERESQARFGMDFTAATGRQKEALLDAIAFADRAAPGLAQQVEFFRRFRFLAVGAFYTTEAGIEDVGYLGNVPLAGDYPGPSDEAMAHLAGVLEHLGLDFPD